MTVIARVALSNSITFVNRFCANRKVITFNHYIRIRLSCSCCCCSAKILLLIIGDIKIQAGLLFKINLAGDKFLFHILSI